MYFNAVDSKGTIYMHPIFRLIQLPVKSEDFKFIFLWLMHTMHQE